MLEAQKSQIYQRSRMLAKGVSEEEIAKAQQLAFKPAFVDGKRKERDTGSSDGVPSGQFAFRRPG
jgi:hypothetical protein